MGLLSTLRHRRSRRGAFGTDRAGRSADFALQEAVVTLWLEMAYGDGHGHPRELRVIRRAVRREFGIDRVEAASLVQAANWDRLRRVDFAGAAERIQRHFDLAQRQRLLAIGWDIVVADGRIEGFERAFLDYVRELVGLTPDQAVEALAA